ncbi:hypothetical protein R70723_19340 [Paenibacillus sp. FSL R7-0273]|uniref:S41 family peptidase n=1 Tax=Paenibacillus sp. FSL R7-0273 TaxID=1536772 RepID=UPI0004F6B221|nr:S41 family peptidase [Paenibacillus sp. FSL R7-0273]AIQ47808.1 hypothetical protein R70723_19340 [Paenibacillus sp. FSL R7-0273]OMF94637.1 hypothetical protein BK144_08945 [Paenibacillus sp. FSL R7-0273]
MKAKWKLAALLLVSAAVVAAASIYITFADSGDKGGQAAGAFIKPEQMKQDLDFLTETLVQVHPALINGWSSGQQQAISEAYETIQTDQTEEAFHFIVNTITSLLHDGHTNMYWELQNQKLLDLPLFWSKDGLVVTEDRGTLRNGDIVTAMSGRSIDELERELAGIIPAENKQWVRVQGTSLLRAEFMLRHLGLAADNQVEVTVKRGAGTISETLELADKLAHKEYRPYPAGDVPFSYSFEDELSLGIFQLNTCVNNRKYQVAVQQFFDEVKSRGIQHVAVDLRSNGGGDSSVINEFLAYTDVESYYSYGSLVRYSPQVKKAYGADQDSGIVQSPRQLIKNVLKTDSPYKGKLYLLTSAHTFSSANMFAVIVQDNGLGRIIGEATGNQPSSYGDILTFQLPASGIHFQTSFKQFTRSAPERDPADSLQPDIEAYTTAKDIIERRDAQLEMLREIVRADLKLK